MNKIARIEPVGFADFWKVWLPNMRNSDGRGKARAAYQKRMELGDDPHEITEAATFYFQQQKPEERPYTPLASSWLNGEAHFDWLDRKRLYEERLLQATEAREKARSSTGATGKTRFLQQYEARKAASG